MLLRLLGGPLKLNGFNKDFCQLAITTAQQSPETPGGDSPTSYRGYQPYCLCRGGASLIKPQGTVVPES